MSDLGSESSLWEWRLTPATAAGDGLSSLLDIASYVLSLVEGDAEVSVDEQSVAVTRFANSFIHQNVADTTVCVRLRLHLDGRTATGTTSVTSVDGLRGLVERTTAASRLCPPDPAWPGVAPPADLVEDGGYDEATAQAGPNERAERVRAFVAAAGGLETAGYCQTAQWRGAVATSAGQAVTGRIAEAAMDGIARLHTADGVARTAGGRLSDIDGAELGARAAAKAQAAVDPVELPAGRYEVVFEPAAVADLLANLAFYGFNGKAHNERRSFARLGEAQFDPAVTIVDDPPALGRPYDLEGTPKRRLALVDGGTTRVVAHDRRTAAKAGASSTGHAGPTATTWGPIPTAMSLLPGLGEDLISTVERGLLVSDLWYTRVLDPKTLVVTGLTRNGVWLIEQGKVTTPVRNFRFTQSYPQALAPGAVLGVGADAATLPGGYATARIRTPALHLASWNFTGTGSG